MLKSTSTLQAFQCHQMYEPLKQTQLYYNIFQLNSLNYSLSKYIIIGINVSMKIRFIWFVAIRMGQLLYVT